MLTAEFCGAEFAASEFATDPRNYADIYAAGPLQLLSDGRCAVLVDVKGEAQIGVTADPKTSAVNSFYGVTSVEFTGLAAGGSFADISAGAATQFTGGAVASYIVPVEGTASFEFHGLGVPQDGGVEGTANWQWGAQAHMSSTAGVIATGSMGFMGTGSGQAVTWVSAPTGHLQWASQGRAQAVSGSDAYAAMALTANAKGGSFAGLVGTDSLTWSAIGRVGAAWNSAGTASLSMIGTGSIDWSLTSTATGTSAWSFAGVGAAMSHAGANGSAAVAFASDGRVNQVVPVVGIASWLFAANGHPGGAVYTSLPRSRARFDVPAKAPAFVVP